VKRVGQLAASWGYRAGWAAVRWLPERVAKAAATAAADLKYRRNGKSVRRLRSNLARVVPADRLEATVRAGMRSYARYWLEAFRLPVTPRKVILAGEVAGFELIEKARAENRGILVALPHMGNWDMGGAWFILRGFPFATVQERLRPEDLFDRFVAYRTHIGMEVLPLTGGEQPPFGVLARRLREGGAVCLVADRDLSRHGVEVEFFGARTRMPGGPAMLAMRTGAILLPTAVWYDGPGWAAQVGPELPVPADGTEAEKVASMTQQLADYFAAAIAAHPQDWHMLQRLWLDDLHPDDPRRADPSGERAG
jgi:KDO2-lipid IV(A) lauroyltransferase